MRLHNRQVKAGFWTDTELIRNLPRDARLFYVGLWQLADDSGCLEDDMFACKILLFPGDADITPETLEAYRDKLINLGKVVRYEAQGRQCLYLVNFHKHQSIKNPSPPDTPLPPWVRWEPFQTNPRTGKYVVSDPSEQAVLQPSDANLTSDLQSSSNLNLNQNLNTTSTENVRTPDGHPDGDSPTDDAPEPTDSGEPTEVETTLLERQILHELKNVKGYQFDYAKDLEFIRTLAVDYPGLDLLAEVKKWRTYKMDKPLKAKSNQRLQLRNWCEIAQRERGRLNNGAKRGRADPRGAGQSGSIPRAAGGNEYADYDAVWRGP